VKQQLWVNLNSIDKAKDFADIASGVSCEVDVCSGRYVVDGKSLLGLFSLDLSAPVRVVVHGTEEECDKITRLTRHLLAEKED